MRYETSEALSNPWKGFVSYCKSDLFRLSSFLSGAALPFPSLHLLLPGEDIDTWRKLAALFQVNKESSNRFPFPFASEWSLCLTASIPKIPKPMRTGWEQETFGHKHSFVGHLVQSDSLTPVSLASFNLNQLVQVYEIRESGASIKVFVHWFPSQEHAFHCTHTQAASLTSTKRHMIRTSSLHNRPDGPCSKSMDPASRDKMRIGARCGFRNDFFD